MKGVGHALARKQGNVADGEITENVSVTKALSAHRSVCQLTKALNPVPYCSVLGAAAPPYCRATKSHALGVSLTPPDDFLSSHAWNGNSHALGKQYCALH